VYKYRNFYLPRNSRGEKRGRWAGFVVMARRHKQHIFSIKIKIKIRNFSFSFKKRGEPSGVKTALATTAAQV
jgi:hypothetical protein